MNGLVATPSVSVVIPTRNRASLLAAALDSLTRQTLSPEAFEVLVIDNGSTDETAEVVRAQSARLTTLRYFYEAEPGLHVGRHRGMLEALGSVLVFGDDDIEALPSWLSAIHEAFLDPDVAMVGGNNLPMFLEEPPEWLMRLWRDSGRVRGRSLPSLSLLELSANGHEFRPYPV